MSKLVIRILCLLPIIANSCSKPCHEPDYTFLVNDYFLPEKDSINVGDTLWLFISIPKIEKDITSQVEVNFSNAANLGDNLVMSDISKFNVQRNAEDSFAYFNVYGKIYSDQYGVKQLSFAETDTAYQLKVGLIAKRAGLYILSVPDITGVYRNGSLNCGRANFQVFNGNSNKHLYLFENLWGEILSSYDARISYCVKVKQF